MKWIHAHIPHRECILIMHCNVVTVQSASFFKYNDVLRTSMIRCLSSLGSLARMNPTND